MQANVPELGRRQAVGYSPGLPILPVFLIIMAECLLDGLIHLLQLAAGICEQSDLLGVVDVVRAQQWILLALHG
jgi:hypothetical protein